MALRVAGLEENLERCRDVSNEWRCGLIFGNVSGRFLPQSRQKITAGVVQEVAAEAKFPEGSWRG